LKDLESVKSTNFTYEAVNGVKCRVSDRSEQRSGARANCSLPLSDGGSE
jgi:hypothetical protein